MGELEKEFNYYLDGGNGLKVSQTNARFLSHPRL